MQIRHDDNENREQWLAHFEMHGIGCKGEIIPAYEIVARESRDGNSANNFGSLRKAMASTLSSTPTLSPEKPMT